MSSYTDLIGKAHIENAPPDGLSTVQWWINEAPITGADVVLDLACSTGFSSRNIVRLTGAQSVGIDVSAPSIAGAELLAERDGIRARCRFELGDAESLRFSDGRFSVVVVGSVFGFFNKKAAALDECRRVLAPEGRVCVGTFYFLSPPTDSLLDTVKEQIGFRPDPARSYQHWKSFFCRQFEVTKEKLFRLPVLNEVELSRDVVSKLANVPESRRRPGAEEYETLLETRRSLNSLRAHQGIALWILKKR